MAGAGRPRGHLFAASGVVALDCDDTLFHKSGPNVEGAGVFRDAALYDKAPLRTGKRGRPRTRGERLPTPAQLAAKARRRHWHTVSVDVRGRSVERLVYVRDVLWYTVNKRDLLRLVIVRDPNGIEPDDFFITTDLAAGGGDVASRYAGRWSIEVAFRDVKQHLGAGDPQSWKRQGPERPACLSLWLHALTWC